MEVLAIEPTAQEPGVTFNHITGEMHLWGKSYSYESADFFEKLRNWVEQYISSPAGTTTFTCNMEYLNSSSQKQLAELIFMLNEIHKKGKELKMIWKYEFGDEDMLFFGELINDGMSVSVRFEEEVE